MLNDIALLGAETARTRAYIKALHDNDLLPRCCILLRKAGSAGEFDVETLARSAGILVTVVDAEDVNTANVVEAISGLPQPFIIFSGPGGAIVRRSLFATGKRFIHVHPGRLPDFRGSTTIYYSLLAENRVEATAFFLDENIDTGPIIGRAVFDPPSDRTEIDHTFDPRIRASLLVTVLHEYARNGRFAEMPQPTGTDPAYYIIHPVLKHLAILAQ